MDWAFGIATYCAYFSYFIYLFIYFHLTDEVFGRIQHMHEICIHWEKQFSEVACEFMDNYKGMSSNTLISMWNFDPVNKNI